MTRKHLQLIADVIYDLNLKHEDKRMVAGEFASALKGEDPRFDNFRFLNACLKPRATKLAKPVVDLDPTTKVTF